MKIYIVCQDKYELNNYLVTTDLNKALDLLRNHHYSKDEVKEICYVEVWDNESRIGTYTYDMVYDIAYEKWRGYC